MSRSCKLPDCYPTSVTSFNLNDTFQNVNTEAVFYSSDLDGNEMDPVSLSLDSYDTNSLKAVGINSSRIYRIDIPSNMQVTVYSKDNFEGDSKVFNSKIANLRNLEFKVSSLIIENTESEPAIINSNVVKSAENNDKLIEPDVIDTNPTTNNNSDMAMMDTQKQLAVTNSVITNQMKSERWINGISNTTIVIIIFILLLIIILKK